MSLDRRALSTESILSYAAWHSSDFSGPQVARVGGFRVCMERVSFSPECVQPSPARPRRRARIWPWLLLSVVLIVGGCGGFFLRSVLQAKAVAEAQLGVVQQVTSSWDLSLLYEVADPALKVSTPEGVAKGYFEDWRQRLGPSRVLRVSHYSFRSAPNVPTIVDADYDGQFQHGTAVVHVEFRESSGGWAILGINVTNIVATQSTTAQAGGE